MGDGPLTFEDVVNGKESMFYFKKFCLECLSTEVLLCWLELTELRPDARAA